MRLLLVGSTAPWAIERHYFRYLSQSGLAVEMFDPSRYIAYTAYNHLMLRAGILRPYKAANEALVQAAERFRPHLVWIFKGAEFAPESLMQIRRKGIKLVNYNPDHPFVRTSFSHGGKNVANAVPLYDLHFCYSLDLAARIEKDCGVRTAWLPFGFELEEATYERICRREEICRVGFIGNPDPERARIVGQLAKNGLPVDVYGFGWKKFLSNSQNIRVFDAVLGESFWEKIREYRVQLNIFRPHNTGSHNMRSFEIPAAGGIMLTPENPEQCRFFSPGNEVLMYRSEDEIEKYCCKLLSESDVGHIRENARRKSLEGGYSYENRAATVIEVFEKEKWL